VVYLGICYSKTIWWNMQVDILPASHLCGFSNDSTMNKP